MDILSQASNCVNRMLSGQLARSDQCFEQLERIRERGDDRGTLIALPLKILKSITHPTMLARYNLRGQEASDDSGAFFFVLSR